MNGKALPDRLAVLEELAASLAGAVARQQDVIDAQAAELRALRQALDGHDHPHEHQTGFVLDDDGVTVGRKTGMVPIRE